MSKPNKEGWIRHKSKKCPVDNSLIVQIRRRDGYIDSGEAGRLIWSRGKIRSKYDIMAYRIHNPKIEQMTMQTENLGQAVIGHSYQDNPFEWRDRVQEIDAAIKQKEDEFSAAIESLEEERVSLVQKLEDEGFRLIGKVNEKLDKSIPNHADDMSDFRNWKVGDTIRLQDNYKVSMFASGELVRITESEPDIDGYIACEYLDGRDWHYVHTNDASWHSRPSDKK